MKPLIFALLLIASFSVQGIEAKKAVRIKYERVQNSSVIIGHGTAFGVDLTRYGLKESKYLLSAAHNVLDEDKPYSDVEIEVNNNWSKCEVLAFDKELDICLLKSSIEVPISELSNEDAKAGATVTLAGSPRGVPVAIFEGKLIKRFAYGSVRSLVQILFDHGDSGGPLFSKDDKVIGLAIAGVPKDGDLDHTVGLFIPTCVILSFLEENIK